MKKRIGIYSPYWSIFGGGERYLLTIAQYLSREHEVDLYADKSLKRKFLSFLGIPLDRLHILNEEIFKENIFSKFTSLRYDRFIYISDGSLFFPYSQKNFVIIQSPIHIPKSSVLNKLKFINTEIICYSQFMKNIIYNRLGKISHILPPGIDTKIFKCDFTQKENVMLSVGRYFQYPHNKKHDYLIKVFNKNIGKSLKGWKLIIAGGLTERSGKKILEDLHERSKGKPVEIFVNPPFTTLVKLYKHAKIYLHAAGFGENEKEYPERMEHFGITTLEGMASGAVPVVFNAGGQKDIIQNGKNGFLWNTEDELVNHLKLLVGSKSSLEEYSKRCVIEAREYSLTKFYEKLSKILF